MKEVKITINNNTLTVEFDNGQKFEELEIAQFQIKNKILSFYGSVNKKIELKV